MRLLPVNTALLCLLSVVLLSGPAKAANPSADQALKLIPVQAGVDFDRPAPAEAAKCKILAKKIDGHVGWIVESPNGTILRRFVDTNGDNVVDQWSYFKDGLEVYRDIDPTSTARPTSTAGSTPAAAAGEWTRTRTARSTPGRRSRPKKSPPRSSRPWPTHDANRFARLVLTADELKSLGLGKERTETVAEKIAKATAGFKAMSARQKTRGAKTPSGSSSAPDCRAWSPPEPTARPRTCGCMKT